MQTQEAAKFVRNSFAHKEDEDWKNIKSKREGDGKDVEFSFQYDIASNQQIKEIVTKYIYNVVKDKQEGDRYKLYKKEGTVFKDFDCIARVIVGYREDSFQVKWPGANAFGESGVKTEDVEKDLRREFAKWCL